MIALLFDDRCTRCNLCVAICPTNVLEAVAGGVPRIARPGACQTCFQCELHCQADAIYVAPDCRGPEAVDAAQAEPLLGQYRRESGWHEWAGDPAYADEHWRMGDVFRRAAMLRADPPS
jgi:NAD-dependent dihydropyrimidine dehydrogenase PreA subunit